MSKTKRTAILVLKGKPGFQPGHARLGGRTKRTAAEARALANELGVDPLEYMLGLLAADATEELEIANDGTERRVKVPVSRELKIDISKNLANFFYPRLTATQVTGADDGPVAIVGVDISKVMQDAALVEMAQTLAIALADRTTPYIPPGEPGTGRSGPQFED